MFALCGWVSGWVGWRLVGGRGVGGGGGAGGEWGGKIESNLPLQLLEAALRSGPSPRLCLSD